MSKPPSQLAQMLHALGGVASGSQWIMHCPAHADSTRSLTVDIATSGKVLLHCHAGCKWDDIYPHVKDMLPDATDATPQAPSLVATYPYTDLSGQTVYEVQRYTGKTFRQRHPDGKGGWTWNMQGVERVPYRWPKLHAAAEAGRVVFIVEGEKDVETLEAMGFVATCVAGGSNAKIPETLVAELAHSASEVIVIPDNDAPGIDFAERVVETIGRGRLLMLPVQPKGDVTDWVQAGGNAAQLKERVQELVAPGSGQSVQGAQASRALSLVANAGNSVVRWPFANVDRLTGPLVRHGVWYVVAFSGRGKTSYMLSACEGWIQKGVQVYYLGLEMRPEELRVQWACRATGADPEAVLTGQASEAQVADVMRRLTSQQEQADACAKDPRKYAQLPLGRMQFSPVTALDVATLRQEAQKAADSGADVMVIDHIDHVTGGSQHGDAAVSREVNRALESIKNDYNMVFVATSQSNMDMLRGNLLGSYQAVQPNHVWFPGVKRQVANGMLSLHRPLTPMPEDVDGAKKYRDMMRKIQQGTEPVTTLLTRHEMQVTLMKHRLAGSREGQSARLYISRGSVRDWTSADDIQHYHRVQG